MSTPTAFCHFLHDCHVLLFKFPDESLPLPDAFLVCALPFLSLPDPSLDVTSLGAESTPGELSYTSPALSRF